MTYYNRKCEKIKLKLKRMDYLNCGQCSQVFCYENIIFKEYFNYTNSYCRLNSEMFDILKTIDNEHFIKLYEIYSNMTLVELFKYKKNELSFMTDAYTAKYYVDDSTNVLCEHIDYILDNFKELEILFDIFSENAIRANDIKRSNAIINSDSIIIIDPDTFSISQLSKKNIKILNKVKLLNLLRSILFSNAINESNCEKIESKINNELINFEVKENTEVVYEISKKLKYVKRPIDYLIK